MSQPKTPGRCRLTIRIHDHGHGKDFGSLQQSWFGSFQGIVSGQHRRWKAFAHALSEAPGRGFFAFRQLWVRLGATATGAYFGQSDQKFEHGFHGRASCRKAATAPGCKDDAGVTEPQNTAENRQLALPPATRRPPLVQALHKSAP